MRCIAEWSQAEVSPTITWAISLHPLQVDTRGVTESTRMQILELAILPAIAAFNNVQGVQESQLLNCISSDDVRRAACAGMGFSPEAGLNALRLLSSFREWAILAILVCPGRVGPEAQKDE